MESPEEQEVDSQQQASQQPPVQIFMRTSDKAKSKSLFLSIFPAKRFRYLAWSQLILSIVIFFTESLILSFGYQITSGLGFLGAALCGIIATLGLLNALRPTKCILYAYLVLNIFYVFPVGLLMLWLGVIPAKYGRHSWKRNVGLSVPLYALVFISTLMYYFVAVATTVTICQLAFNCCGGSRRRAQAERQPDYVAYRVEEGCATQLSNMAPPGAAAAATNQNSQSAEDVNSRTYQRI